MSLRIVENKKTEVELLNYNIEWRDFVVEWHPVLIIRLFNIILDCFDTIFKFGFQYIVAQQ